VDSSQRQGQRRHRVPGKCIEQEGFLRATPMNKQKERIVPAFATEAEEAEWWHNYRNVHDKQLLAAVRAGEAKILTKDELRRRVEASKKKPAPVVALRIPAADLALARKQAAQKRLPYQTYIKSLLHETLAKRERQKVG
jgi:predicted DNA binding CopG/RHH family protein